GGGWRRRRSALGLAGAGFLEVDQVLLGHLAVAAGALDPGGVDAFLVGVTARGRRQPGIGVGGGLFAGGLVLFPGGRGFLLVVFLVVFLGVGRRSRGGGTFLDDGQHLLAFHGVAGFELDFLDHAVHGGGHFQHHLVGFEVDQVFVAADGITDFLVPVGDGGVGDRLGQDRDFQFGGHIWVSFGNALE